MTSREVVAVTGGSGFIGRHLVEALAGKACVRSLQRGPTQPARVLRAGVVPYRIVAGDLHDDAALARLCSGASVVVHCAATMRKSDFESSRRINVEGTERLARAAGRAGVGRFVYVSSISVLGATPSREGILTESDAPTNLHRLNNYARTKLLGEEAAAEIAADSGMALTIVRPTNVYGPGSQPWFHMYERMLRRVPLAFGDVPLDLVHVRDVVDGLVSIAGAGPGVDGVFHLGGAPSTLSDFIARVGDAIDRPTRRIPRRLDRVLRTIVDKGYPLFTGTHLSLSLTKAVAYPHTKATAAFGYAPKVGLDEGFRELAIWWRGQ